MRWDFVARIVRDLCMLPDLFESRAKFADQPLLRGNLALLSLQFIAEFQQRVILLGQPRFEVVDSRLQIFRLP